MTAWLSLLRPEQWWKNVFVFTGFLFSQRAHTFGLFIDALVVAAAFCLASSAVYIGNDLLDIENDRQHPKKKNRPLASGRLDPKWAAAACAVLALAGLYLSSVISYKAALTVLGYLILNIFYCTSLKHIVVLDVFSISCGFMLRILAGTFGLGIPPSRWLLLCGMMVTLFLGFAKRRAELQAVGQKRKESRPVLAAYSLGLLDLFIAITVTGVIITYSLYTMSPDTIRVHGTENLIFTAPLVFYAFFRYLYLIYQEDSGDDHSRDIPKDSHIRITALLWISTTAYLAGWF